MTDCAAVVAAYRGLRDSLVALADRATDRTRAITLRQRALIAGELAEQCDGKFSGGDVPHGDRAVGDATQASQIAINADGDSSTDLDAAASAAAQANTTLNGIVQTGPSLALFTDRFRGALRVSPPAAPALPDRPIAMRAPGPAANKTTDAQPAYVASVAMLFPTEAVTLFPLGQSIAGNNGLALTIVILLIVAFVIVVRYFATQEEGGSSPAIKEILIAVVSFLLWVGSLKGYWVTGGKLDTGIDAKLGGMLYGFATIMWVAIVPYFVRKPTPPSGTA